MREWLRIQYSVVTAILGFYLAPDISLHPIVLKASADDVICLGLVQILAYSFAKESQISQGD